MKPPRSRRIQSIGDDFRQPRSTAPCFLPPLDIVGRGRNGPTPRAGTQRRWAACSHGPSNLPVLTQPDWGVNGSSLRLGPKCKPPLVDEQAGSPSGCEVQRSCPRAGCLAVWRDRGSATTTGRRDAAATAGEENRAASCRDLRPSRRSVDSNEGSVTMRAPRPRQL